MFNFFTHEYKIKYTILLTDIYVAAFITLWDSDLTRT